MITTADALSTLETRGYLWDLGQLPRPTKIFLWKLVKMGRIGKSVSVWPWFGVGTAPKTIYHHPDFNPRSGTWNHSYATK